MHLSSINDDSNDCQIFIKMFIYDDHDDNDQYLVHYR